MRIRIKTIISDRCSANELSYKGINEYKELTATCLAVTQVHNSGTSHNQTSPIQTSTITWINLLILIFYSMSFAQFFVY